MLDLPLTSALQSPADAGAVRLHPRGRGGGVSRRAPRPASRRSAALRHAVEPCRAARPPRPAGASRPRAERAERRRSGGCCAASSGGHQRRAAPTRPRGWRPRRRCANGISPARPPTRTRSTSSDLRGRLDLARGPGRALQWHLRGLPGPARADRRHPARPCAGARTSTFVFVGRIAPTGDRELATAARLNRVRRAPGRGAPAARRDGRLPGAGGRAGLAPRVRGQPSAQDLRLPRGGPADRRHRHPDAPDGAHRGARGAGRARTGALAAGILGVLGDPARARRLAAAARSYAQTHLGWAGSCGSVDALYDEVERHAGVA